MKASREGTSEEVTPWLGKDEERGHLRMRWGDRLLNKSAVYLERCDRGALLSTETWAWTEQGLNPSSVTHLTLGPWSHHCIF